MLSSIPLSSVHFRSVAWSVADPGGGANPAMAPPIEIGNGVWPPLRDRKSNGSIVILLKSKEFAPPLWKHIIYKTQKRSMTKKKVIRNFEEIDGIFGGNGEIFGEIPKKRSLENFFRNFA